MIEFQTSQLQISRWNPAYEKKKKMIICDSIISNQD